MTISILYVTFANVDEAKSICKILVRERLAACCNILGDSTSIYNWDGKLCEDNEVAALVKTSTELASKATARIRDLHSYDTPCIIEICSGPSSNVDYVNWLHTFLCSNS